MYDNPGLVVIVCEVPDLRRRECTAEALAHRLPAAPEHRRFDGRLQSVPGPVHGLVRRVAIQADGFADLGRREAMTQAQIEDLGVAVAERRSRLPDERHQLAVFDGIRGIIGRPGSILDAKPCRRGRR